MSLPPPPDSYFEGGEPQSHQAPGDTGRELIHEVRNLQQVVVLLQRTLEKTRAAQRKQKWVSRAIASLLALTVVGFTVTGLLYLDSERERARAVVNICLERNAQNAAIARLLNGIAVVQAQNPAFSDADRERYKALFADLQREIAPVDCNSLER